MGTLQWGRGSPGSLSIWQIGAPRRNNTDAIERCGIFPTPPFGRLEGETKEEEGELRYRVDQPSVQDAELRCKRGKMGYHESGTLILCHITILLNLAEVNCTSATSVKHTFGDVPTEYVLHRIPEYQTRSLNVYNIRRRRPSGKSNCGQQGRTSWTWRGGEREGESWAHYDCIKWVSNNRTYERMTSTQFSRSFTAGFENEGIC